MAFVYEKRGKDLFVDDPIYGKIVVPYPYSEIALTKEMQRLGKITQNGFSKIDFADLAYNDRLSHSVGAFHVMELILQKLDTILSDYNIKISQDDKEIALSSMLIHDIGHGPFSHSLEMVTEYSHEKRTTDILLGDTEINRLLVSLFGQNKVKKIASFIAEINDAEELGKDSFTKLLNSLVSHQLDADRLDYLMRDAYYSKVKSSIDLDKILSSLNVVVNNNNEYELIIDEKGLSSIENVLIQRYQMYRDVYLCPNAMLGNFLFLEIMKRFQSNSSLQSLPLPGPFVKLAEDRQASFLPDFLEMTDEDFNEGFNMLAKNSVDPLLAYISDFSNISDYIMIKNDVSEETILASLEEIFNGTNLEGTLSIIRRQIKNKLYKREQGLKINSRNRILDLSDCTNLIRPQETFETSFIFFNPEILRLELGLTTEEFAKYQKEIDKMLAYLNKKPEEFELKYILQRGQTNISDIITLVFKNHGFNVVSITEKENSDEYYDTNNLDLYKKGGSLRIRTAKQQGKVKYKGTYKIPTSEGEVYSSRTEIEEALSLPTFDTLERVMGNGVVPLDFSTINPIPILNSTTRRTDIVLEKNGIQVCFSLDSSTYTNHKLGDIKASDMMIEIEAMGNIKDRIILNEIHDFLSREIDGLELSKQSKYVRGIDKTLELYSSLNANIDFPGSDDNPDFPPVSRSRKKPIK